jgi:pilus assembly protein Flp/PilA
MSTLLARCVAFLKEEDGPTAVEYAVMLAFIFLVVVSAVRILGDRTSTAFQQAADSLPGGS